MQEGDGEVNELIVQRIQALLRMTEENGATASEAANAAALVQKLLFKYNLELSQVREKPTDPLAAYRHNRDLHPRYGWEIVLLQEIAQANFCSAVMSAQGAREPIHLIGKPDNIEVVKALYQTVRHILIHLANQAWRRIRGQTCVPVHEWKYDFYFAAVTEITRRLQQQRQEDQASEAGMALVVVSNQELEQATASFIGRTGRMTFTREMHPDAARAGREAGQSILLQPTRGVIEG